MQVRPMSTYRGRVGLTTFDPIKNTPGTRDYVNAAREYRGSARQSVVSGSFRAGTTYTAGALERGSDPVAVPSVPRRQYIPTVGKVPTGKE